MFNKNLLIILRVLVLSFITLNINWVHAQNVNGGLINVAQHSPAFINFPDEINNIELDNPAGKEFFFLKIRSDKMLSITFKGKSAPPAVGLIISEGKRTHHFKINYLENYNINKDPSLYYDFSDIKELRKYVESLKNDRTQSNLIAQAEAEKEAFRKKEEEIEKQRAADEAKRKQEAETLAKKRKEEEEMKKKLKAEELERKQKELAAQRKLEDEKRKEEERKRLEEQKREDERRAEEERIKQAKILEEEKKREEQRRQEEQQRLAEEKAQAERERQKEIERKTKEAEEQRELARKKAIADSIALAKAQEEVKVQELKDKKAKEEAEALAKQLEKERKAREEADRAAREEDERLAKAETDRVAKEESDKKALIALQEKQQREEDARKEKERKAEEERQKKLEFARIEAEKQEKIAAEKKAALEKLEMEKKQKQQNANYTELALWERYGSKGIVLYEMPTEQYKLNNADFYIAKDTLKNFEVSQHLINTPTEKSLDIKSNSFADGVTFTLEEIKFEGFNAYFKVKIDNKSKDDFLMGPIAMYWYNSDKTPKMPVFCSYVTYIGFFPLVRPDSNQTIVFVTRTINMMKGEDLMLNIKERRQEKGYSYVMISDEAYNRELDKTDKMVEIDEKGDTELPVFDKSANEPKDPKNESDVIKEKKTETQEVPKAEIKDVNEEKGKSKKKKKADKDEKK